MKTSYDIDEIRQSPRNFVDLETIIWLSDRVAFLESQIKYCNLELNYVASELNYLVSELYGSNK